jgi:hypothetical protein
MPRLIKFTCQNCGTKLAVPQQMAGVSDSCPKCGQLVTSPTLEAWQASLAAAQKPARRTDPPPAAAPIPSSVPTPPPTREPAGWSAAELADALNPPVEKPVAASDIDNDNQIDSNKSKPRTETARLFPLQPAPRSEIGTEPDPESQAADEHEDDPSLLSRMLNGPKLSDHDLPPVTLRQSPLSTGRTESEHSQAPSSAPDPAPDAEPQEGTSSEESFEPRDDAEDELEIPDSPYKSPHAPGMGEMLTAASASAADPASRSYLASPFLSGPDIGSSKPKRRKGPGKFFIALLYFLAFDLVMLWVFRKQAVEFWHENIARTTYAKPPVSPGGSPTIPPPPVSQAPAPAEAPLTPPVEPSTPEASLPAAADPSTTAPTLTPTSAAEPGQSSAPAPAPAPAPVEMTPVPQAIPITEDQLAKLPNTSLEVPSAAATPPATPNPASDLASASTPAATKPAATVPESAPTITTPPATAATAPAAAPGKTASTEQTETSVAGLPPPPADMALPNGPMPTKSAPVAASATTSKPASSPTPPPFASSSTSPRTNRIPAEAKSAFEALLGFIQSPNWKTRAKYSIRGAQLNEAMTQHARGYGDGPIAVEQIEFIERYTKTPNTAPYCMFELKGGDLTHQVLALVIQPDKGSALVDWEAFMEFRHDYLLKFLENPGAPKQQFRVLLRRKHYFDKDVPGIDSKECYQVTQPNLVDKYEGHVFVQKNTPLSTALGTQLGWGMDMPVIVELAWKSNKTHQWVEILSIPHHGWRNS